MTPLLVLAAVITALCWVPLLAVGPLLVYAAVMRWRALPPVSVRRVMERLS